jgi:hypothetical protein
VHQGPSAALMRDAAVLERYIGLRVSAET